MLHQLFCPLWFDDIGAWSHLCHVWLDIKDRCAIHGIQIGHEQASSFYLKQPAGTHTNAVRTHPGPLGEDADSGPGAVTAGVSRTVDDLCGVDLVEEVDDVEMRELVESGERVRGYPSSS